MIESSTEVGTAAVIEKVSVKKNQRRKKRKESSVEDTSTEVGTEDVSVKKKQRRKKSSVEDKVTTQKPKRTRRKQTNCKVSKNSPTTSTVLPTTSTVLLTTSTVLPTTSTATSTVLPNTGTVLPTTSTVLPNTGTVLPTTSTVSRTSSKKPTLRRSLSTKPIFTTPSNQPVASSTIPTVPSSSQPVLPVASSTIPTVPSSSQPVLPVASSTISSSNQPVLPVASSTISSSNQPVLPVASSTISSSNQPVLPVASSTISSSNQPVLPVASSTISSSNRPVLPVASSTIPIVPSSNRPVLPVASSTIPIVPSSNRPLLPVASIPIVHSSNQPTLLSILTNSITQALLANSRISVQTSSLPSALRSQLPSVHSVNNTNSPPLNIPPIQTLNCATISSPSVVYPSKLSLQTQDKDKTNSLIQQPVLVQHLPTQCDKASDVAVTSVVQTIASTSVTSTTANVSTEAHVDNNTDIITDKEPTVQNISPHVSDERSAAMDVDIISVPSVHQSTNSFTVPKLSILAKRVVAGKFPTVPSTPTHHTTSNNPSPNCVTPIGILKHTSQFDTPLSLLKVQY